MKTHKLVKSAGAYCTYTDDAGEQHKFQTKDFPELLKDEKLKSEIYQKICECIIMKYKSANSEVTEGVEYTDGDELDPVVSSGHPAEVPEE